MSPGYTDKHYNTLQVFYYTNLNSRLAAASDKVYQLLVHDRWFSPGTLASSITKTSRHYIAEILLKVVFNTKYQSINHIYIHR